MNMTEFFQETSKSARTGYNKPSPSGSSFAGFRMFAKSIHKSLLHEREEMENQIEENSRSYINAGEKNIELKSGYDKLVKEKQSVLTGVKNKLIAPRETAIEKYTVEPPTDKQMKLYNVAVLRIDTISDREWNMIVSECASNYQASALLRDLAEKHGKLYQIPFDPEEQLNKLHALSDSLDFVIDHIGEDPYDDTSLLRMAEFFNYDPSRETYGQINILCEEFDSGASTYVPESIVELTDPADLYSRLMSARNVAYHNKAMDLFGEIVKVDMSIRDNGLNEENLTRAEYLINYINILYPEKVPDNVGAVNND